jgi:lipid-binding SYLF domain-containing protein
MNLLSTGFQAGAKAYSEMIFFQDKRALDEFESGHFGADASAGSLNAGTSGGYYRGMAVFTVAKGGFMYAATISGQQFACTPRGGN